MNKAVALGNNDVAFLAWSFDKAIVGCLGFAIFRVDALAERTPLPAWVGFEGQSNTEWNPSTTERWPVQKFSWRDLTARPGQTYTYEIVPMIGTHDRPVPAGDERLATNAVTLTPSRSAHIRAYFNRGILSTQHLVHELPQGPQGRPSGDALLDHIIKVGDPIRESLAGEIIDALTLLLKRGITEGGRCYCALYELDDPELISLLDDPRHVSLVLSNADSDSEPDGTNRDARERLHADNADVVDRMLPKGHIGHDKFVVYVAGDGTPQAVLTGSTNWTSTGLCGQVNNAIVIDDSAIAQTYLDFWRRLQVESPADEKATQSTALRTANNLAHPFTLDGADVALWFSPNTLPSEKPKSDPPRPSDMAEVFQLIAQAKQGIFFLLFQPGSPSVLDAILDVQAGNQNLFVRGAATDPLAIENYETTLFHRTGDVATVAAASALNDQFAFWQQELLKAPRAHAIIHDKIVVIDPRSINCVVVMGSHNLGYRASYTNDENLLVVKGHRGLAEAYAVHVMDVYDHYRWRYLRETKGDAAFAGLVPDDRWQAKYFARPEVEAERRFWLSSEAVT
jgi:phosphatidylserine/phosphatidylglycerophosphate/cardiolipin synthase-like enzyme